MISATKHLSEEIHFDESDRLYPLKKINGKTADDCIEFSDNLNATIPVVPVDSAEEMLVIEIIVVDHRFGVELFRIKPGIKN